MRKTSFKLALSGVLLSAAFAAPALAQSAQQLINQLKPSGALSDTTRGIKPIAPGEAPAPAMQASPAAMPAMNAPAAKPQAMPAAPSANLIVDFASGSAVLTPQARATLDQLGKALTSQQLAAYHFKIVGHTDTTGTAPQNQTLSEQRADAVKSYLQTKFGVADTRLQASGVGEADLAVQTPPNTPNRQNRRVEIINIGQ
ncbi:OmpA family protein [Acidocella facilis]|uniref:OmpA family protein n=1 Tax=Acidocella facilis TaxID=525 RepID=UPI000478B63D|nr:OmpA family protein [Acidocella facilis]